MLKGKKILVGITGSIAAYKSAYVIRLLIQSGAEVRVVMSPGALQFVTPLTFSTLSKNPVHSDFTENKDSGEWNHHVDLAIWADLMLIAPLSADTLSKMASAQCDNFLMAVYMSARCPVMVAPAMDHDMFIHPGTQENLKKIKGFGHHILAPQDGELASGLRGRGRMEEPEEIHQAVIDFFHPKLPLRGKRALVTAGPTFEKLDPVRFIGNFSSGKMGFAIAQVLADFGAQVTLVSGPVHLDIQHPSIDLVKVMSAQEMFEACQKVFDHCDIAVMAAAVADYKPAVVALEKVKKKDEEWSLAMTKTIDIAAALGKKKTTNQVFVGFALETEDEIKHAEKKLASKNFNFIVLNSLKDDGAGFGTDTNKITLIWPGNKMTEFGLKAKSKVAEDIVQEICKLIKS
jgi:phosphopantothenoylcysteine decarboxylase/phosphopantothenate--cysteine ligase